MSLSAAYQQFLAAPNPATLASDASLSYVPTLTSVSDGAQIVRHLTIQQKVLRKQSENVLTAIENDRAVFLETETTIEFLSGGGAYLPGLDDNFLADRTVTFPILHVVHFDPQGRIQNVRIYWDQGSLLKMVEVIGSRGKNWPVNEGKDQIRLITSSGHTDSSSSNGARKQSTTQSRTSIQPFAAYAAEDPEKTPTFKSPPVAPRATGRPPPRDFGELLAGGESDASSENGPPSPTKSDIVAPKIGAGKNYHENRLFDNVPTEGIADKYLSPHPKKYNHFEFGDGHDEPAPKPSPPKPRTKHQSQWDFVDFVTPAKAPQRKLQQTRSFAFDEDPSTAEEAPLRKTSGISNPGGRRDAETHFELQDDGDAPQDRPKRTGHPKGQGSMNTSASLFQNDVISEEGPSSSRAPNRPMSMAYSQKDRKKDFGAHWEMTDDPSHGAGSGGQGQVGPGARVEDRHRDFDPQFVMTDHLSPEKGDGDGDGQPGLGERSASERNKQLRPDKKSAVKMMENNWEATDSSPVSTPGAGGKENVRSVGGFGRTEGGSRIRTGGDGMGGRVGTGRSWGIGEEDQPTSPVKQGKGRVSKSNVPTPGFWDY